ncbi:MAG: 50S ribosomal protein L15 [Armatimonadota bacterium]
MNLNNLQPNEGSKKRKRRVARGIGSGLGKTAGRGTKGQKARRQIPAWFEGGQTPIHRRLPIKPGFRNINHKEYAVVNLDDLEKWFAAGDTVTPESVVEKSIVSDLKDGLKILAFGQLTKKLTVNAHRFSKAATAAIEKAGGKVTQVTE